MELKVFTSNNGRKIVFEPNRILPNGFIEAKKWLNSTALSTGHFEQYTFNASLCRNATIEEKQEYQTLKDFSQFALNAD